MLNGCGNAVGPCKSDLYSVTITPSPYKKHCTDNQTASYKTLTPADQEYVIMHAIMLAGKGRVTLQQYSFEKCQNGNKHLHGILQVPDDLFIYDIMRAINEYLGYTGKHNKLEHVIKCDKIFDKKGWEQYMYKENQLKEEEEDLVPEQNIFYNIYQNNINKK